MQAGVHMVEYELKKKIIYSVFESLLKIYTKILFIFPYEFLGRCIIIYKIGLKISLITEDIV